MKGHSYRVWTAVGIALVALFFSIGGLGYAKQLAGLINGHQIKKGTIEANRLSKRARKALKGKTGARGPQGPKGDPGPKGDQGPPGPVTSTLPRGVTLRGTWNLRDQATTSGQDIAAPISWGFSLASAPATHLVPAGSPAPSGCAGGSVTAPAADPGNVCIYVDGGTNATTFVFDPATAGGNTSETYGTGVIVDSNGAGEYGSFGTWAVTGS